MRRRPILIVLVAIISLVAIFAARVMILAPSRQEMGQMINEAWQATTHERTEIEGQFSFSMFARPEFILTSATIKTASGAMLKAERIGFGLSFTDLIQGTYRIATVSIEGADLNLPQPLSPQDVNDTEKLIKTFILYFDRIDPDHSVSSISQAQFRNVNILFQSPNGLIPLVISDGTIVAKGQGAFSIDATGRLAQAPFESHIALDAPDPGSKRERATQFSYRDDGIRISGKGITAIEPNFQYLGTLIMQSDHANDLAARFLGKPASAIVTQLELQSQTRLSFSVATLSDMTIKIGKTKMSGNMMADFSRKIPRITGTFAASDMDLSEFADQIGIKRDAFGHWSRDPFSPNLIPDYDFDLRVSSELVTLHDLTIKSVAVSVLTQDKNIEVALASADLFDGSLSGKISISPDSTNAQHKGRLTIDFNQIDLERALVAFADSKRATGMMSGHIALTSAGQSTADLMSNMAGLMDFDAERTSINGISLLNFMHRIESRPIGVNPALKSGSTDFDTAQITIDIANGVGTLRNANMTRLPDLQIKLSGQIDFTNQSLAITGHALGASAVSSNQSINLPFIVKGNFDDPIFLPDLVNLSKQSGPIAP